MCDGKRLSYRLWSKWHRLRYPFHNGYHAVWNNWSRLTDALLPSANDQMTRGLIQYKDVVLPVFMYRKSIRWSIILRPSYLHNGISYTGKMTFLYWDGPQSASFHQFTMNRWIQTPPNSPTGQLTECLSDFKCIEVLCSKIGCMLFFVPATRERHV